MFLKGFQRPKRLEYNAETLSATYGEFYAQPLERGYGTTIGNALRRTLLSSIEGAAVSAVRIEGAPHEFSSLPGVLEDTTDIILNLKQVFFKSTSADPQTLTLKAGKAGRVTAADIECPAPVEVLNPEQYIATLGKEGKLHIEIQIKMGRGYVPAEDNFDEAFPQGFIPLDSSHSPVRKVSYRVEGARVGRTTDYDKLTLQVWTNGAVTPQDALAKAAFLMRDHMALFINFEEGDLAARVAERSEMRGTEFAMEMLGHPIEELEISSTRARRALETLNIHTIGDLVQRSEDDLLSIDNFGKKSLDEIKKRLQDMGLTLGMRVPSTTAGSGVLPL
jgi:DNA-directed RNA polymerase subunit alpha